MRRLDHEAHYKTSRVLLRNRLWEGPSPVAYFRLIDTFAVRRVDTLDNLGFQPFLEMGGLSLQAGNSVDDVHRQIKPINLIAYGEFQGEC
jgi:hypothetical protein